MAATFVQFLDESQALAEAGELIFFGAFQGIIENPDYRTERAVFNVERDRSCNEYLLSTFDAIRKFISIRKTKVFSQIIVIFLRKDLLYF